MTLEATPVQNTQVVETQQLDEASPEVLDAKVYLFADQGHMQIELMVEPPENGGRDVELADLQAALAKEGVVYGIQEQALAQLAEPTYGQKLVVAQGTPAVDGEDGTCTEMFPRELTKQFAERADGSVDYRELSLINEVKEGTLICQITPPTDGTDGTNTKGHSVKAREGKKAIPPLGENTRVTADGLRAEATVAGNLVFRDGRFLVETIYRVQNVDYDSGNITFSGDVLVNGDMLDGFEIHAGGDVTLRGQGGAVVIEAANITIEKGINGAGKARLEAKNTLKAGFIENCNIQAGEKIIASSIINSQVECEGDVEVMSGKGIICGGKVTAFGSIKAKEIGNDFNTLTVISLGVTPKLLQERKRLSDQLADVSKHIEELAKNVAYIERLVADGRPIPPERVQMLQRVKIQLPMSEKKKEQLEKGIAELETRMSEVNMSTLTARIIHAPTKVSIGALSQNVVEPRNNCRVYKSSDGELVFGSA